MAATLSPGSHEIGDHVPCHVSVAHRHSHQGVEKAREPFREARPDGAQADDVLWFEVPGGPSAEFERS